MSKEYIPLFLDFNETTQDLTDEECGRLVRAIVDYANDENYEYRLSGAEKIAFRFLKGIVDRNQAISEKRAQAGATRNTSKQEQGNGEETEQTETNNSKGEQTETNANKTEQNEAKTLTKKEDQKPKPKTKNENDPAFDAFWAAYPNKKAKPDALRAWMKLKPDDELAIQIMAGLERWKGSGEWNRDGGQYIPHPATWLNRHSWEDEVQPVSRGPTKTVPAQQYEQRSYTGEMDEAMAAFLAANGIEIGGQT